MPTSTTPDRVACLLAPLSGEEVVGLRHALAGHVKRAVGVIPLDRYVTDGMMTVEQAAFLRGAVRELGRFGLDEFANKKLFRFAG